MTQDDDAAHGSTTPRFSGAILAGGRARRFGSDKCRHAYRGRTLLEHALASLVEAADVMVVGADAPEGVRARSVPDLRPGCGPLGGLHAALCAARFEWLAVTACDMPHLDPGVWPFLLERAAGLAVVPEGPSGVEPLAGIYHRDLVPAVEARLDDARRSLKDLVLEGPCRILPWSEVRATFPAEMFLNANRPEDLP